MVSLVNFMKQGVKIIKTKSHSLKGLMNYKPFSKMEQEQRRKVINLKHENIKNKST